MKFKSIHKIHKATGERSLSAAWFDREGAQVVAIDGRILVVVPVTVEEGDETGLVSEQALKAAVAGPKRETYIKAGPEKLETGMGEFPRDPSRQFPDWEQVIPSKDDANFSIMISVKLLKNLLDAMGANQPDSSIELFIKDGDTGVLVEGHNDTAVENRAEPYPYGVIMPKTTR